MTGSRLAEGSWKTKPMSRPGRGLATDSLRSTAPPSVLPDISPSRGEIGSFASSALPAMPVIGESADETLISPLEGEMSGRTEGGALTPASPVDLRNQSILPLTLADPGSSPATASASVLLPEPLPPMIASRSPAITSRLTPFSAVTSLPSRR
ncbi:hypothetical protein X727_30780 [Mesorhizobium sp. L103C119B0]|nr:hypothetical protein X727_30780 [Mesorhizobium sp. L103C119B0]